MTFKEYQEGTRRTWNTTSTATLQYLNALIGLMGEVGELSEIIKKTTFHRADAEYCMTIQDLERIHDESGDILYYLTRIIDLLGLDLEDIATRNQMKLKVRYPDGFRPGGGVR